jgi:hypothetical protein
MAGSAQAVESSLDRISPEALEELRVGLESIVHPVRMPMTGDTVFFYVYANSPRAATITRVYTERVVSLMVIYEEGFAFRQKVPFCDHPVQHHWGWREDFEHVRRA